MPRFRPRELKKSLKETQTYPRKNLSQTFLIDGNVIRKTLSVARVKRNDVIVEIGPGTGAITEALLDRGAQVIAVEKDAKLAALLIEEFKEATIFVQDILSFPLENILLKKRKKARVIANIPYHLTGPIIALLLPLKKVISEIFLFLQLEVARRICACPGGKKYGALTIFVNLYSDAALLFKVKRSSFFPPPKIDSAVVRFTLKDYPKIEEPKDFFALVKQAFGQRRKTVKKALKPLFDPAITDRALTSIGKLPTARAEELSPEDFISLYRLLTNTNSKKRAESDKKESVPLAKMNSNSLCQKL